MLARPASVSSPPHPSPSDKTLLQSISEITVYTHRINSAVMQSTALSQAAVESKEPSPVDLATCHTSSVDDSNKSHRAASLKSSTMMSTSPNHRRMEPFIRPPPMIKEELLSLTMPDVMKPDSYRIPRRESIHSPSASTFNSKNLNRLNKITNPSLLTRVKDKVLHRSNSQKSKSSRPEDEREIPFGVPPADLDWLTPHIGTSTQKSSTPYLSESRLASIERWRIAVYLTDLLKGM
ncbi:hypothetical protein Pst134EA_011107 [Puccinia striiformis f. sp. tritici]|uniref:hypothetical protein n=1 Tax=Puccinia striiformis f. sp. tritici TaxID=168172 RepID=UPI0020083EBE|nr:hypothetical protein Pst134EA_011107 [Puccinia striiformis f. sp. tritici]KAH9467464.1 hypothetical protein Pst134EA_011107 [Puccinia striiformis f. sp. tritici]